MYVNMGVYDRMRLDECGVSRGVSESEGNLVTCSRGQSYSYFRTGK